jgi:hypothetical protein
MGSTQISKSQLDERSPWGSERGPFFHSCSMEPARSQPCCQHTSWGLLPLTNGTKVVDKSRAHESDCTAGAENLRIWWVAFLVRHHRVPAPACYVRICLTLLLPPKLLWLFHLPCCTDFDSCQNCPLPTASRSVSSHLTFIAANGLCESPMEW